MLFGMDQKGRVSDPLRECLDDANVYSRIDHDGVRSRAFEIQRKLQEYNKEYFNKRRREPRVYRTGDYVLVRNFD